ncbi:unknown [Bacteroides sp. CAG:598]|nr:unknown [Bacteroides sp. CAG:598]
MFDDVVCQSFQPLIIGQYDFHSTHGFLACYYIFFCSSFISTLSIIVIDSLYLFAIKCYLCDARYILQCNRYFIVHRLLHGVRIHNFSKDLDGFIDGSTCKAHKRGMRESTSQMFCIRLSDKRPQLLIIKLLVGAFAVLDFQMFV